jgi:DNA-directed RNA polymerase subunit RPC12/RpoP
MADLKFTCSHCGQEIECDELWSGREIQCPTCQKELTVPPKPDAPPHAALAAAKPRQARLSIDQTHAERIATTRAVAPQVAALEQQLAAARAGQKGNPMKWVTTGAVVVVLAVGGYFGYGYFTDWQAKRSEAAKQAASNAATQQVASATAPEAAPAATAAAAPEKELPIIPPIWTLDVDKANIPEARANGMIAGTNFVVETARLDQVGTTCLLRLLQGAVASPDRAFMIYLHPNAGESVTGHTYTVSQDMKGRTVPQVVKLWKTNPRYQAQQKTLSSGYAMKLEFGQITNGMIPGKIFLAVPPETEQSVVAGVFKAATSLGEPSSAALASPVVEPTPAPAPAPPKAPDRSAFDKRYGGRR